MKMLQSAVLVLGLVVVLNAQLGALPLGWRYYSAREVAGWSSTADHHLYYYNFCTGWALAWSGWQGGWRPAVVFDSGCEPGQIATLVDSRVFCPQGAGYGYGFTGTISVHDVDASGYPVDPPIDSQSWRPLTGNNEFVWNTSVGERFALVATLATEQGHPYSPVEFVTECPDHWSGPDACGLCYSTTRPNHSFVWAEGQWHTFYVGADCLPQLVFDAGVNHTVNVGDRTWGRIKALYR